MPTLITQGQLFVVSAPSGAGKTTLIKSILPQWPNLCFSVSCTTRLPRPGEIAGKDYHFLSRDAFVQGIHEERFLEWARVHDEFYGTDGNQVREWLGQGKDVLLDIDVQGARQVRCAYPLARTIFVIPPSLEALRERLLARNTETPEKLERRLHGALEEVREAAWYDFVVINDVLSQAMEDFQAILKACRCDRLQQASQLKSLLKTLTYPLPDSPAL